MPDKNLGTLSLALMVSLIATVIGIKNLVWFVQFMSPETAKIERSYNPK